MRLVLPSFIVIVILIVHLGIQLIAGNLETLFSPRAQIDQLSVPSKTVGADYFPTAFLCGKLGI